MSKARIAAPERCAWHKKEKLGYVAWHLLAEKLENRGVKQRRCPACKLWFFKFEWKQSGMKAEIPWDEAWGNEL